MEGAIDIKDLERFLPKQAETHANALAELRAGHKETHWIWWEMPQLRGLGASRRALDYGLADLDEATRYLAHPILRQNLIELCEALLLHEGERPQAILGGLDALKVRSMATLFALVPDAPPIFEEVLNKLYRGIPCPDTMKMVA